jgi:hypothetical protein
MGRSPDPGSGLRRYDGPEAITFGYSMAADTITLALNGEVPVDDFSRAIEHFARLVSTLTEEVGRGVRISWVVDQLEAGSAITTIRGEADDLASVERVVRAYADVGEALAERRPIPFSPKVADEARAIVRLLGKSITSVRFETDETDTVIVSPDVQPQHLPKIIGYGAVEGRVQTLSSRGRLRFTLYDALNDRAVICYVDEDRAELMRKIWGRRVIVEGLLTRDPATGQPQTVRSVTRIEELPDNEPGSYRRAIGALRGRPLGLSPEDAIRRLRDAG